MAAVRENELRARTHAKAKENPPLWKSDVGRTSPIQLHNRVNPGLHPLTIRCRFTLL